MEEQSAIKVNRWYLRYWMFTQVGLHCYWLYYCRFNWLYPGNRLQFNYSVYGQADAGNIQQSITWLSSDIRVRLLRYILMMPEICKFGVLHFDQCRTNRISIVRPDHIFTRTTSWPLVQDIWCCAHYNDVIMSAMASKSPAPRLFTQPFVQAQIKEDIKAPRHWSLWGESPVTCEFPAQRASNAKMLPFDDVTMGARGSWRPSSPTCCLVHDDKGLYRHEP